MKKKIRTVLFKHATAAFIQISRDRAISMMISETNFHSVVKHFHTE